MLFIQTLKREGNKFFSTARGYGGFRPRRGHRKGLRTNVRPTYSRIRCKTSRMVKILEFYGDAIRKYCEKQEGLVTVAYYPKAIPSQSVLVLTHLIYMLSKNNRKAHTYISQKNIEIFLDTFLLCCVNRRGFKVTLLQFIYIIPN
jgi:hypothetical protein